jgi:2-haloacid dehalogenase
MKDRQLKAFVFDAYGTLFDVLSISSICEDLFPGHGNQLAALWRKKQLEYTWLRSLMRRYRGFRAVTSDALDWSAHSLNLKMTEEIRSQLMNSYLHLATFPDVQPGLAELKQIGMRVAILSNGEPRMIESTVENAGLSELVDVILSADAVKRYKPDPDVYDQMIPAMKIQKSEIGFVSANDWDVQGAGSAGFTTFRIQRSGFDKPEELGFPATFHVNAITDLRGAISQGT